MSSIDFVVSNKKRRCILEWKDLIRLWSWSLSDHRPLGFGIPIKKGVIRVSAAISKLARQGLENSLMVNHGSVEEWAKN